jgi:hypothetical protein
MITVSIDLTKVPKEQIVEKNGKKYLNIVVDSRREPDTYGNTHTVYISQTKEQRQAQTPKTYIGSGKEYTFQSSAAQTPQNNSGGNVGGGGVEPQDIPF